MRVPTTMERRAVAAAAAVFVTAALGLAACYAQHEPAARSEPHAPGVRPSLDDGGPADPDPRTQCERWCDHRATVHESDGFCPPSLTGRTSGRADDCELVCIAAHDSLPAERIETCIRDYALCYRTLDGCAGR